MAERESDQSRKFKEAARDLDCDPNEKAWEERLRKVAAQKPDADALGTPDQ